MKVEMSIEDAKELRMAWAAMKEGRATDAQVLLLVNQDHDVLDHLSRDYHNKTSPYRTR